MTGASVTRTGQRGGVTNAGKDGKKAGDHGNFAGFYGNWYALLTLPAGASVTSWIAALGVTIAPMGNGLAQVVYKLVGWRKGKSDAKWRHLVKK